MTAAAGLGAAEVEGFAAVDAKGLLVAAKEKKGKKNKQNLNIWFILCKWDSTDEDLLGFLGRAPPTASAPVLLQAEPLADDCLAESAAAPLAEVVLVCPTDLLSGTLV